MCAGKRVSGTPEEAVSVLRQRHRRQQPIADDDDDTSGLRKDDGKAVGFGDCIKVISSLLRILEVRESGKERFFRYLPYCCPCACACACALCYTGASATVRERVCVRHTHTHPLYQYRAIDPDGDVLKFDNPPWGLDTEISEWFPARLLSQQNDVVVPKAHWQSKDLPL